jgi:hypothetical protein
MQHGVQQKNYLKFDISAQIALQESDKLQESNSVAALPVLGTQLAPKTVNRPEYKRYP